MDPQRNRPGSRIAASTSWSVGLVFAVAVLVYGNTLLNRFAHDDHAILENNPRVIGESVGAGEIFSTPYWPPGYPQAQYRPVTIGSFRLQYRIHGLVAWPYHLLNVLLFAGLCSGIVLLLRRLGTSGPLALGAGLLYAVHPLHTEAVAPVVGRSELLAAVGVVAGLLAFVEYVRESERAKRWVLWGGLTVGAFVLALLSKENAIALPGLALGVTWIYFRSSLRSPRVLALLVGLGAVGLAFVALHFTVSGGWQRELLTQEFRVHNPLLVVGTVERCLNAVLILARYVRLLVVPFPLICDYTGASLDRIDSALDPRFLASVGALLALAWGLGKINGRDPLHRFGLLFFAMTYAPVSQIPFATGIIMAERLMLLPTVGLFPVLVLAAANLARRWTPERADASTRLAGAVLLLVLAGLTIERNRDWRDSATLAFNDVRYNPRSPILNYVCSIFANDARRVAEAREFADRAVETGPEYASAHIALGVVAFNQEDFPTAEAALLRASELRPDHRKAHHLLAVLYGRTDRPRLAARRYRRLLELDPSSDVRFELARALARDGSIEEAESSWQSELAQGDPDVTFFVRVAEDCCRAGRPDRAQAWLSRSDRHVAPGPETDRAWVEMTGRMIVRGDLPCAAALLERLLQQRPGLPGARINLAGVRRRSGAVDEARRLYEEIIADSPGSEPARMARQQLDALSGRRTPQDGP